MNEIIPTVEFKFSPADFAKAAKKLDKWQGAPLKTRTQKAIANGMRLLVTPVRNAAPGPGQERPPEDAQGTLKASVAARAVKLRTGEIVAYVVGPRGGRSKSKKGAPHRHLVIQGHKMVTHKNEGHRQVGTVAANAFVDRAIDPLIGQVKDYINTQITRLA